MTARRGRGCRAAPRGWGRRRPSEAECEPPPTLPRGSGAAPGRVGGNFRTGTRIGRKLVASRFLRLERITGGSAPALGSVEPDRLMGAVEREGGDADRKAIAAPRFHLLRPHHDP